MQDAWRAYLELAFGLTEASRKRAKKVAKDLTGKGGATAAQLQSLAEDLLSTSRKNREGLARLVRYEVDRALGALGLATAEEVGELTSRIRELEWRLRESGEHTPPAKTAATSAAGQPSASKGPASKTVAKKAVAKKTTPAKSATAKTTAPKTTPAKTTSAKTTSAKTTAPKAAPTKATSTKATSTKAAAGARTTATNKAAAPTEATG